MSSDLKYSKPSIKKATGCEITGDLSLLSSFMLFCGFECVQVAWCERHRKIGKLVWSLPYTKRETRVDVTQIATSKRWQRCDLDSEEIFLMHGFSFTESRSVLAETSLVDRLTFISDTSNNSLQQIHTWELYFHYYFYLPWIIISNETRSTIFHDVQALLEMSQRSEFS